MNRFLLITRITIVLTALVALIPIGRMVADWVNVSVEVARRFGAPRTGTPTRGYDWVSWQEEDGQIKAVYVFPRNEDDEPGLQEGDIFYQLNYEQYFTLEDLQRAVEGIPHGSRRTYTVLRGDHQEDVVVRFTRYPTFLYPLSPALWQFSLWGFIFGAFFHVLGFVIAVPLVRRSRTARFSLLLIVVSFLWIFGNLLRLLMVHLLG
ncbi:MAG: histidine kinase, partial [Rhodothermales bacterium]